MANKWWALQPGISLKAQLLILLMLAAVSSFLLNTYVSVQSTQHYLNTQMQSHARDTATSLGLSMSAYLDDTDLAVAHTMSSAIFDSGDYASLEFITRSGDVKIQRKNPIDYDEVPAWFVSWFPLTPPKQSTEVNNGWMVAGVLSIQSNPGIAYQTLWQQAKTSFYTSAFITVVSLLFLQLIVFAMLSPLRHIERQALAVSQKNFVLQHSVPFTTDLRSVVNAMNSMVANIQRSFQSLSHQADELKLKVFTDQLTGLGNRRLLEQRFIAEKNEQKIEDLHLFIGMMSLHSLTEVNQEQGFEAADHYILTAVNQLQTALAQLPATQLFRLSGSDFVFISQASAEQLEHQLQQLSSSFKAMNNLMFAKGFASLVLMDVAADQLLSDCLAMLDSAMMQRLPNATQPIRCQHHKMLNRPTGRAAWHSVITALVQQQNFELWLQPVLKADFTVEYNELLVRFDHQQSQLSTAETFAMAEQYGLSVQLDQQVVRFILQQLPDLPTTSYAVNLSQGAVSSALFLQWLDQQLKHVADKVSVVFELSEHAVLHKPEQTKALINMMKSHNCKVCIQHFGASLTSFSYLQGLNIDYVKIDGAYATALTDPENKFFIKTLCQVSHGIGIKVLVPHIGSEHIKNLCFDAAVDAVQGNWLFAPQKVNLHQEDFGLNAALTPQGLVHQAKF